MSSISVHKKISFENKLNNRYYYIQIERDLLNNWLMVIHRGGDKKNVITKKGFECEILLNKEILSITKRRLQRGYSQIQ